MPYPDSFEPMWKKPVPQKQARPADWWQKEIVVEHAPPAIPLAEAPFPAEQRLFQKAGRPASVGRHTTPANPSNPVGRQGVVSQPNSAAYTSDADPGGWSGGEYSHPIGPGPEAPDCFSMDQVPDAPAGMAYFALEFRMPFSPTVNGPPNAFELTMSLTEDVTSENWYTYATEWNAYRSKADDATDDEKIGVWETVGALWQTGNYAPVISGLSAGTYPMYFGLRCIDWAGNVGDVATCSAEVVVT